eukprot:JP447621.1.p1 GENE.JP447621.1~~JP447621.1.p1  ORF type:complete len:133 (+),score=0.39 JP447621.1:29-400(+)
MKAFEECWTPKWVAALVILPPMIPFFARYSVWLEDGVLRFGYVSSLCSKSVKLSEIESVDISPSCSPIFEWGGWGIRMSLSGHVGYIASSGPVVNLSLKGNKKYTFSCNDASTLVELIQSKKD